MSKVTNKTKKMPSLVKSLLKDIFFYHWTMSLLAVLAIVSAMMQAKTTHKSRQLVSKLQQLEVQNQLKEIERQALKLELTSLTEPDRISREAKEILEMVPVTTETEKVIEL